MKKAVVKLKKRIEELEAKLDLANERCMRYEQLYNHLLHNFKQFQRNRFGSNSERFPDSYFGDLFADESQQESLEEEDPENKIINIGPYQRRKRKTCKFPPDLPRREQIIKAKDRVCSCGREKKLLRYEITELLHMVPAQFEVIEQKREVLGCPCGCDGSVAIAENPPRVLPKVSVTESVLAYVIVSKLHDRQPLYHLAKKFTERFGIDLSRSSMARWFIDSAKELRPLINLMKDHLIEYDIASADATSIQVLNEPNRKATQKSYWYCIRGGPPDKKVILYDYNPSQHKKFIARWFEGFKGYIHVDAQNIFDDLEKTPGILLVNCTAHGRRKFEPIARNTQSTGLAKEAMLIYRKLYRIEKEAAEMSSKQRYEYRLEYSQPILNKFKHWLDTNYQTVLPQSPLGKAMAYSIRHWKGLVRYLQDGRLEIDNNSTEREIKPGVIARKNFLFACSVSGAEALCVHMSLIRSAILYGFDPYQYYVSILETVPYCKTVEDYEAILPWNIELKKVREIKVAAA